MEDFQKIKKASQKILNDEKKHLQLVPSVAVKLLNLTHDDNVKLGDLSKIIETEPTLAAKILRNVNSAAYALPNKISSIHRAVNILGFASVRRIALTQLFYNNFIKHESKQQFDQLFFWQHCLFVASLSRAIAISLKHPEPDLIYTAGLMHDIGKVILESYGRSSYSDFLSANKNSMSILDEERLFFGLTHTEIGFAYCLEWQMPAAITAVVAGHHQEPSALSELGQFQQEVAIVSLADSIAWMQGLGSTEPSSFQNSLQKEVLDIIDVEQLNLEKLLLQVDQEMEVTREFYGIKFPSVANLRTALVKASINQSQNQPVKVIEVLNNPKKILSSLTAPHQSLNPDVLVPRTLEAIQQDFTLDRVMMLIIDPKRRCLVVSHCFPNTISAIESKFLEIDISSISGLFLECLREKKPVIINSQIEKNNPLLKQFRVAEYFSAPVLHKQRLLGILYADNVISKKVLNPGLLSEIAPVAFQMGIALVNAKQYEMEKKQAQLDPLTQLYNKRMVNQVLHETFLQHTSVLSKIAVGFIDIDKFKMVNDVCGHQLGDEALIIVAEIMVNLTRPGDFIGRYGGEEFVFLLRNTDETGAFGYAERIRKEIEKKGKQLRDKFHHHELTVSIGLAIYHRHFESYADMIKIADQAMYDAKRKGRNQVVMINNATEYQEDSLNQRVINASKPSVF